MKSSTMRYVVTIALLMAIVGGIAWVTQQLPKWQTRKPDPPDKRLIVFLREALADWRKSDKDPKVDPYLYVEPGAREHYDFLFQNESDGDVDLISCRVSCGCSSVKACVLPAEEWERVNREQTSRPGLPLPFAKEPEWQVLPLPPDKADALSAKGDILRVKAGGKGAVRVEWHAQDGPGSSPNLTPEIAFRSVEDPGRGGIQKLAVLCRIVAPVEVNPARITVGALAPGKSVKAQFVVWSSTRDTLDFALAPAQPDPLFEFTKPKPLPKEQVQAVLNAKKVHTRVLCGYAVDLTVHESKDGKFLDQGSFYKKFPFALDGKIDPNATLWGPEIVGRVEGDVRVGGADQSGRINLKSFSAKEGTSTEVALSSDAGVELEKSAGHPDQPAFIQVKLTRGEKLPASNRTTWLLQLTIPPGEARPGVLEEPNAIVLRIAGAGRLLRIPLEGHITR